jgi:hypothetical protein
MVAVEYVILITVHLRGGSFEKGQVVTREDMGISAFILIHFGLAAPKPHSAELAA